MRIDVADGAPRFVVDGRPIRARIFWGAPGSRPLGIGPEAKQIEFEFTPAIDVINGATMHFRFGNVPGEVFVDDISVVDAATGEQVLPGGDFEAGQPGFEAVWNIWPTGAQNTVGTARVEPGTGRGGSAALHVSIKAPPDKRWPDFHLHSKATLTLRQGHRYRASLWVRSDPARGLTVSFYKPGASYQFIGGPPSAFASQIKLAGAAGATFVSMPVNLPWPRPGQEPDFASSDSQCQAVLDANPDALLIPRIGMDAPSWWLAAHPEESMVWDDGPHKSPHAVPASPIYRREAAERLAVLVTHLEQKFGPHVAGYHPNGQNTGEWFYHDTWLKGINGYAKADERSWRQWLTEKYKDDAGLRAAWHDPQVTLQTVTVPAATARRAAPNGALHDPTAQRPLIDFNEYQQQMMADCVRELAHACRQASGGRKLVLFFYGYLFEFSPVNNGPATSGHYGLRRVLDCPDIDVLCSPISYFDRGLGQSSPAMTAAESVALAGKMWLYEDDTHTYLATGDPPGSRDHVDTLELSNRQLLRNTAQCALRNFATWWMDLGASGWFDDPGMWEQMKRLAPLDQAMLDHPRAFRPQVAAVVDERSMLGVAGGGAGSAVSSPCVGLARAALGRSGAPYGQYLMDDVLAGKVHAKVYVMLNAWRLSPEQRRQLLSATRGATRLWCYAPGYQDDNGASPDGPRELTGFSLQAVKVPNCIAQPTPAGQALGLTQPLGTKRAITPLFAAADAKPEQVLARYSDGSAAAAMRQSADGTDLFVGPPGLTSELIRLAAHRGGAHLYTTVDCNVYANGPYVVLHAADDGQVRFTAPVGPISDLLAGQILSPGPTVTFKWTRGETKVLRLGKD